jgi:hypothetical protein
MRRAKWALAIVVFAILSMFFAFQYNSVLAADAQQGETISRLRLVETESNTSEPQLYIGLEGTIFESNVTVENPTGRLLTLSNQHGESLIWLRYFREKHYEAGSSQYLIAEGLYLGNKTTLYPGNNTFDIEMKYSSASEDLTSPESTTPFWYVTLRVKYGFSARILEIEGSGSMQICTHFEVPAINARADSDETYPLMFAYLTSILSTWIIGIDTMLIIELARAKDAKKVKRLGTLNFVLLGLFIICSLLLFWVGYPSPPMAYYGPILPGSGGIVVIMLMTYIVFVAMLSLATALGLLFDGRWSRALAYVVLVLFVFSPYPIPIGLHRSVPYHGPTGTGSLILQASFLIIIVTTFIMILKLKSSELQ